MTRTTLRRVAAPGGRAVRNSRPINPTMRSLSIRSRNSTPRSTLKRRAVAILVSAVTLSAIVVACSDQAPASVAVAEKPQSALDRMSVANAARDERPTAVMSAPVNESVAKLSRGADQAASGAAAPPSSPSPSSMPSLTAVSQPATSTSMIIRTGHAGIEVDSLDVAIARVRQLAQRVGGFVANTVVQGGDDQLRSASLEVKIPSDRFDEALAGLTPLGKVESVNVNAQDVGEEYVDIAARVENAHRLETRLIALLANRTGKLQDVLSVERELARVREEIERYEGRMRFLRARVAMSTLTIAVHERAPIIVPVAGDGPIVVALRDAWRNFVGFVAGFIASLGVLVPLGALAFVGWLVVRRWAPWRPTGGTPPAAGAVSGD